MMPSTPQPPHSNQKTVGAADLLPQKLISAYVRPGRDFWRFALLCLIFAPSGCALCRLIPQLVMMFLGSLPPSRDNFAVGDNSNLAPNFVDFAQTIKHNAELYSAEKPSDEFNSFFDAIRFLNACIETPPSGEAPARAFENSGFRRFVAPKLTADPEDAFPALRRNLALREIPRAGWRAHAGANAANAQTHAFESVADHSIKTAALAFLLSPPDCAPAAFVIAMCHDWPERITGDLTPRDNIDASEKHKNEQIAFGALIETIPARDFSASPIASSFPLYCKLRNISDPADLPPEFPDCPPIFRSPAQALFAAHAAHFCDKLDMLVQACAYRAIYRLDYPDIIRSAHADLSASLPILKNLRARS